SLLLIRGTSESATMNNVIVLLKLAIIASFIFLGWKYIRADNFVPYVPANTGEFGVYGFSGIIRAAAVVMFAYVGFDAVSTAAQETKNPSRNMPIGILGTLLVCTILYMAFSHVMLGTTPYELFKGHDGIAPVALAIDHMGEVGADGVFVPAYPWMGKAIVLAILAGYTSVILVMLLGQSRVFYSMSKDGLLPKAFSVIHPKYRTPHKSSLLLMVAVSIFVLLTPARVAGELTSIGTLFAFILVCIGVMVLRRQMPEAQRSFRTPWVPWIPLAGVAACLFMMLFLPLETWTRLIIWMLIGMDVYYFYGSRHSRLRGEKPLSARGFRTVARTAVGLSAALTVVAVLCYVTDGNKVMLFISLGLAFVHVAGYKSKVGVRRYRENM
ncbi:MAG: amino acid permease, partial [Tannerellaceae bacterium]|nr:amino acid permease [Tannerellaceae bacterium]